MAVEETVGYNTTAKAYPNWKSYVMSSHGFTNNYTRSNGTQLQRARLYATTGSARANYSPNPNSLDVYPATQVNTTLFKEFQYNPPELRMQVAMSPLDPGDSQNNEGNTDGGATLGIASTGVEMLFDRTQETHAGQMAGSRFDEYGRLGVAKDIMDVYAVIKGDKELLEAGADKKSLSALTNEMTDLVRNGSKMILSSAVAIQYSRDFILYGFVTDLSFRFVKFNHMLVPTMGYVSLNMDIHNAGNTSLVRNLMVPAASTSTRSTVEGAVSSGVSSVLGSIGWGPPR